MLVVDFFFLQPFSNCREYIVQVNPHERLDDISWPWKLQPRSHGKAYAWWRLLNHTFLLSVNMSALQHDSSIRKPFMSICLIINYAFISENKVRELSACNQIYHKTEHTHTGTRAHTHTHLCIKMRQTKSLNHYGLPHTYFFISTNN